MGSMGGTSDGVGAPSRYSLTLFTGSLCQAFCLIEGKKPGASEQRTGALVSDARTRQYAGPSILPRLLLQHRDVLWETTSHQQLSVAWLRILLPARCPCFSPFACPARRLRIPISLQILRQLDPRSGELGEMISSCGVDEVCASRTQASACRRHSSGFPGIHGLHYATLPAAVRGIREV